MVNSSSSVAPDSTTYEVSEVETSSIAETAIPKPRGERILRKTRDETPEQRGERKEQERRLAKKKVERSRRASQRERQSSLSSPETRVKKLVPPGQSNLTLEEEHEMEQSQRLEELGLDANGNEKPTPTVVNVEKVYEREKWKKMVKTRLLERRGYGCIFLYTREDNNKGVVDFVRYFNKKSEKETLNESTGELIVSPFHNYKWFERFLISLTNLENTTKADRPKPVEAKLANLDYDQAVKLADGLQCMIRSTHTAKGAIEKWHGFYPVANHMKQYDWFNLILLDISLALKREHLISQMWKIYAVIVTVVFSYQFYHFNFIANQNADE